MLTKRFSKSILALLIIGLLFVFLVFQFVYKRSEVDSSKKMVALCQVNELGVLYTDYFDSYGAYPTVEQGVPSIDTDQINETCGNDNQAATNGLVDPWGDKLVIEPYEKNGLRIYSTNYLDTDTLLIAGKVKKGHPQIK